MQESKYFYNGIPLSKYCKDNNINISTIRARNCGYCYRGLW